MRTDVTSVSLVYRDLTIALAHLIALSVLVFPLVGCGADGGDGPSLSSLSTPADDPPTEDTAMDDPPLDVAESDPEPPVTGPDGEEDPTISVTSTPTGAIARLAWDPSPDPDALGYYVYYGKQSSGQPGSCSYDESQAVEAPPATITGLEPGTPYFFAISAFGESESPCSNEVLVVTPPTQS